VVRKVLLVDTYKFWPTWDELQRKCEMLTSPRRRMIDALAAHKEPKPEPRRRAPTAEEKARISALVDEMFPTAPRDWKDRAVDEATKGECMKESEE
jgi:hypothetical protein